MKNYWKTTVNEIMYIFRGSLLALIPWVEKAKIKWEEGESYDDWENIVETLFDNIVCSSLTSENVENYLFARYDIHYESYESLSYIKVKSKHESETIFVFVSFKSTSSIFDSIKVAELDKDLKCIGYTTFDLNDIKFQFIKNIKGNMEEIDNIEVLL